ncbi:hypothetical protein AC249_AIPGENE23443 [Exaiptasia diaphana]|nr:hypothetical protein AC249_AIPGENE23443 [Exaiptasia diaphana]
MSGSLHRPTFERVPSCGLDVNKPQVKDPKQFDHINLLNKAELEKLRDDYIVLVARVLTEFFPFLSPIIAAVPAHIKHRFSEHMEKKSEIVALPVSPFNPSLHSDVCQYLDELQNFIYDVKKDENNPKTKDEVLKSVQVPLAGDLLGRERITELYQTTAAGGRDVGTLYHLRQHFGLVNVTAKVKNNYTACEALMLSTTKAYMCSAFMSFNNMASIDETPSWAAPILSKRLSAVQKWSEIKEHIGHFVDKFVMVEFDIEKKWREEQEKKQKEQVQGHQQVPLQSVHSFLPGNPVYMLTVENQKCKVIAVGIIQSVQIQVPDDQVPVYVYSIENCAVGSLQVGTVVLWPKCLLLKPPTPEKPQQEEKKETESKEYSLLNYGSQILQLGTMLMQLNDTEREDENVDTDDDDDDASEDDDSEIE